MSPTYELIRMTAFNGSDKHKRELNDGNCFFSVSSCLTWFYTMVFFCFFLYFVYLWKWELLSAKANDKYFGRLQFVFIESKSDWYLSIQLKLTHTDRMNRKLNYTATTGQKNNANEIIEMNYDCLPFTLFAVNTKASILLGVCLLPLDQASAHRDISRILQDSQSGSDEEEQFSIFIFQFFCFPNKQKTANWNMTDIINVPC